MPLINWEINHILTCSEDCVISSVTGKIKFEITDTVIIMSSCDFIEWN